MPSIYLAHERAVFERDGMLLAASPFVERDEGEDVVLRVGALPHGRGHELHRRRGLARGHARRGRLRDRRDPDHRARRDARRRPRTPRPRWRTARLPATSESVDTLRLATAGSVDDGKSTLIGRLLYDAKSILTDQLEHIAAVSHARNGNGHLDLALLTDGLRAEREQGITIDVAHRYFATPRRRFILADTPGHEQYTRNMVTGASTAEVAIVLVDARKGVIEQTRRHAAVAALLGVAPRRARGQQDGSRRLVARTSSTASWPTSTASRREGRARRGLGAADERAARRQRGRELGAAGLVRRPAAARAPRDAGAAGRRAGRAALPGAVGAARRRRRRPRLRRPRRRRRAAAGRRGGGAARGPARARRPRSRRSSGPLEAAPAGQSVSVRVDRDLDLGRGDMLVAAESAPVPARELRRRRLLAHRARRCAPAPGSR